MRALRTSRDINPAHGRAGFTKFIRMYWHKKASSIAVGLGTVCIEDVLEIPVTSATVSMGCNFVRGPGGASFTNPGFSQTVIRLHSVRVASCSHRAAGSVNRDRQNVSVARIRSPDRLSGRDVMRRDEFLVCHTVSSYVFNSLGLRRPKVDVQRLATTGVQTPVYRPSQRSTVFFDFHRCESECNSTENSIVILCLNVI